MRRFVTIGITVLATATAANAQTFMDQLRQTAPGKGTVTVTQSKAIDDLIMQQQGDGNRRQHHEDRRG